MMKVAAVTILAAAFQKIQLYEIPQKLGVTILAFVVTDANLRNVVEKIFKSKFFGYKLIFIVYA
jgi:hypothetical protein